MQTTALNQPFSVSPCFLRSHLVQLCCSLGFTPFSLTCVHHLLNFPANSGFAPQSLFPLLNLNHYRLVLALKYARFFNACCIGLLRTHACTLPRLLLIWVICVLGLHRPSDYEPAETYGVWMWYHAPSMYSRGSSDEKVTSWRPSS